MGQTEHLPLRSTDKIAVIGAGPAGSLFAISLLRRARRLGINPSFVILEKRRSLAIAGGPNTMGFSPSCNFCAGGISPLMNDALHSLGLTLPDIVIQNRVRSITVHAHWKNIELKVPEKREIISVYRGSRPKARDERDINFDTFLLQAARNEGAQVIGANVQRITKAEDGRPVIHYLCRSRADAAPPTTLDVDFVVYAGGVNHLAKADFDTSPLMLDLRQLMPGFAPPRVRKTLIVEIDLGGEASALLDGELCFVLYGSDNLRIEMASLMPKGRFMTAVLIGPDIDASDGQRKNADIVRAFLDLPHVRRILPRKLTPFSVGCVCVPNMVVGAAKAPFSDRVAVIGDMVTCRLYKDGIYSAYQTASALAEAIVTRGLDKESLRRTFWPVVKRLNSDHRFGRLVFAAAAIAFRKPSLSRVAYQSILSERKSKVAKNRRLEQVLWRIASGDDTYRGVLGAMLRPLTLLRFIVGGALITLRNYITEAIFDLKWKGFERYPTGLYKEDRDAEVDRLQQRLGLPLTEYPISRIYQIKIGAAPNRVFSELTRFGDETASFLRPRLVNVYRSHGNASQIGSQITYDISVPFLSFALQLEQRNENSSLVYRVLDGFARGGVLIFDVADKGQGWSNFDVMVAFRIHGRGGVFRSAIGWILNRLFPIFVHDVLWNHALCELKHVIEMDPNA